MSATHSYCPVCGGDLSDPQAIDVCGGCHVSLVSSGAIAIAATGEFAAIKPAAAAALMTDQTGLAASARSCSWCGKAASSVRKLLTSRNVHICNECVGFCSQIMADELGDDWRR